MIYNIAEGRMPMDANTWLYLALFMSWGAFCGTIGYLAGITSKIAPYLQAIRSLYGEKDVDDPARAPKHS